MWIFLQNHKDNHKNSMAGTTIIVNLKKGDEVNLYDIDLLNFQRQFPLNRLLFMHTLAPGWLTSPWIITPTGLDCCSSPLKKRSMVSRKRPTNAQTRMSWSTDSNRYNSNCPDCQFFFLVYLEHIYLIEKSESWSCTKELRILFKTITL